MSTLLPLSQVIDRPLTGADHENSQLPVTSSTSQAMAQLQATIALHGIAAHNVEAIVLDAALGPKTIDHLCRHLIQLKCLYLVGDSGRHARAFATQPMQLAPPQLEPHTCWWLDTGVERHSANHLDEYRVLAQQLQQNSVSLCGFVLTSSDDSLATTALWGVAEDLRFHFGEQFYSTFAALPGQETGLRQGLLDFLDTWSDYLFSQRDYLQALRAYLALHHQNADPGLARLITACWQELACPDLALDWLNACHLAKAEYDEVYAELRDTQRRNRAREREQRTLNHRFVHSNFREWSSLFDGLEPTKNHKLAWLRAHPWVLRPQTTPPSCVCEDYPALVRVQGAQLEIINAPLSPHAIAAIGTGSGQSASLVMDDATQIDLIYNVLRCREALDPGPRPQVFPDLFVQHSDMDRLATIFSACDLRALFAQGTSKLLLGEAPERQLTTLLAHHPEWPLPHAVRGRAKHTTNPELSTLIQNRRQQGEAAWRRCTSRHGLERLKHSQTQLQAHRDLRIWIQESWRDELEQLQFSGLERALACLGHNCRRSGRPQANAELSFIAAAIDTFDPDLLVCGEDSSGLIAAAQAAMMPVVDIDLRAQQIQSPPVETSSDAGAGFLLAAELDGHEAKYVADARTHNIVAIHSTGTFDTSQERAMIDALLAANLPLTIYGGHWACEPGYRAYARPNPPTGVEEITTLAGHSIHIFAGSDRRLQYRALRAALCNTLVVEYHPATPADGSLHRQLSSWLVPAREFLRAETHEQLVSHVRAAIDEPELRNLIAAAGHDKVGQTHSFAARAAQVLRQCQRSIDSELRRNRPRASA